MRRTPLAPRPRPKDPAAKTHGLLQAKPVERPSTHLGAAVTVEPPKPKRKRKEKSTQIEVRRIHRRDLNKVWEFLKLSFRDVNRTTLEYQRPRSKQRFFEIYEEDGIEQLLFTVDREIVAYAECAFEPVGDDTWINPAFFVKREMRPLFVEELAVHPEWHGRGVGSFVLEQLQHLARVRGLTHLVLEVAENNENALGWYRKRGFRKLDAAIFLAQSVSTLPELLPPRELPPPRDKEGETMEDE